jgi:peptidoglycan/LPS O-acetylase OafA/YrhL
MVAVSVGFSTGPLERALRERVPWGAITAALGAFCAAAGLIGAKVWFRHQPVTDALVALTTASLLVHCASPSTGAHAPVLRLLGSSPLVTVGRFSYSLYLTHLPVLALCFVPLRSLQLGPEAMLCSMLALGFPVSVACAYGFFLAVEKPWLRAPSAAPSKRAAVAAARPQGPLQ